MKILIADDNLFFLRALTATVSPWGYEVVTASDGETAWRILQEPDAPRLAIIDWMMPQVDGVELCKRIRARPQTQSTYVLLLTAKGSKQDIITALEAGADDFLRKPFDPEELQARLTVGLRRWRPSTPAPSSPGESTTVQIMMPGGTWPPKR